MTASSVYSGRRKTMCHSESNVTEQSFWFIVRNNFVFIYFRYCVALVLFFLERNEISFQDLPAVNITLLVPGLPAKKSFSCRFV